MRTHSVVNRNRLCDRVDNGGHRGKLRVEIEFAFTNAVDAFRDRVLITVILIGHSGEHADRGELLAVVMATVLTVAIAARRGRLRMSLTTTCRGAVTVVVFNRFGATAPPWCEYVVRVNRGFRLTKRPVARSKVPSASRRTGRPPASRRPCNLRGLRDAQRIDRGEHYGVRLTRGAAPALAFVLKLTVTFRH